MVDINYMVIKIYKSLVSISESVMYFYLFFIYYSVYIILDKHWHLKKAPGVSFVHSQPLEAVRGLLDEKESECP